MEVIDVKRVSNSRTEVALSDARLAERGPPWELMAPGVATTQEEFTLALNPNPNPNPKTNDKPEERNDKLTIGYQHCHKPTTELN